MLIFLLIPEKFFSSKDGGISKLISLNTYLFPASMLKTNSNLLLSKIRAVVELTKTLK